ncbi:HD domain-containing protein [archaeon]|jgi:uncharacterized protein|nr:HD domain-containing protein [archaeon]
MVLDESFFDKLREEVLCHFESGTGHGFDHVDRVYNSVLHILTTEDADADIVRAAALLHDIARTKEENGDANCHAEEGSLMCVGILKSAGFPEDKIDKVAYAIKVHRYSGRIVPETIEAKILQDADRLDALGALTVGRVFEFAGKTKIPTYDPEEDNSLEYKSNDDDSCIGHFHRKTLKITPDKFHTKTAQEIAKGRYEFVKEFVDRYVKEWNGEL